MLKKLLKYDLKNAYKILIVFYGLALFFAILTRVFLNIENSLIMNIIGQVCGGITVSMMFNILINNVMRVWSRFRQNLYGDESYLTHTLPIKKQLLYLSKVLTVVITLVTSILIIALSLFMAWGTRGVITVVEQMIESSADMFGISPIIIVAVILIVLFLELFNAVQCGFTGIILGHRKTNAKMGFSVLYGFLIYILSQMIVLLLALVPALFDKDFMNLLVTNSAVNMDTVKTVIVIATLSYLLVSVIGFIFNNKAFKKGVNVD